MRNLTAAEVAALERCGVTPADLKGQDDDD
jgi:hypothetical protein